MVVSRKGKRKREDDDPTADEAADEESDHGEERDEEVPDEEALQAARRTARSHIGLLQEYNEMRDVAQGLMGLIAEKRGVRIVEVMGELGVREGEGEGG